MNVVNSNTDLIFAYPATGNKKNYPYAYNI